LFKLSFHNHEIKSLSFKKIVLKKTTGTNGFIFRLLAPGQAENFLISICLLLLHHFNNNYGLIWFMVFNATFNNILVLSWQSVLLVEETGVPGENQQPAASH